MVKHTTAATTKTTATAADIKALREVLKRYADSMAPVVKPYADKRHLR